MDERQERHFKSTLMQLKKTHRKKQPVVMQNVCVINGLKRAKTLGLDSWFQKAWISSCSSFEKADVLR